MVNLKDLFTLPRESVSSFGEALPWFGMITDGLVLCHDGSLIAGFEYEGEDIEGVNNEEINQRIDYLQNAMRQLNDRVTLWTVQERRYETDYTYADYPNPVAGYIDYVWGTSCSALPNARLRHTLYLGFSYPNKAEAFFEEVKTEMEASSNGFQALFHVLKKRLTEKTAVGAVRGRLADMADEFEQIILNFGEIVISSLGFRRLFGEELVGDLYSRANIASPRGPIHLPERLAYLNTVLASDDVVRQDDVLEFKGPARSVNCAVLSITTLPSAANSVHMDQLMSSPCEYIMVQTFKFMDRTAAEKTIQKAEEFYQNEVKSVMVRLFEQLTKIESNKVNTGNLVLAQDAQEALVDLTAHEVMYGYYNMTLLALGDTPREAARSADILSTRLRSSGYSVTRERQGIFGAFLGSMPGNSKVQLRKYMVSVPNVADLAPIRTISRGEPTHPLFSKALGRTVPPHVRFMTPYGVPYDFNLHAEDLGHTVVIGGSGSGKTSLMQLLVAQFQKYYPSNTFIFDKDRSMALLTVLMGGAHVDMANPKGGGVMINPVKRMLKDGDLLALSRWVGILLTAQGESLSTEAMEKVSAAIQKMAALNEIQWRLGTLYNMLNGADKSLARRLSAYVDKSDEDEGSYGKGIYSDYFDNEDDDFSLGSLVCMETGKLLQTAAVSAPFMDYAFYCIEKSLDGVTPTLIYVEEAWYMLANEKFEEKINDWLRTFRKKKAFVIFATQSPFELQRLKAWDAFIANVPTFIFLRSIKDSVEQTAPTYRALFNMNDAQLGLLSGAVPKRDYLLIKPGITRLVTASMPKVLLAINEATTRDGMVERAIQYSQTHGDGWEFSFLSEVLNVQI
ncbi:MAG: type IV secretion system protein VirB4 [Rhodoferax sp.]|nr:type IV secretion system protein VirB4 [Rhodoferax sp.]